MMQSIKYALYHWAAMVFGDLHYPIPGFWMAVNGHATPRRFRSARWAVKAMFTDAFLGDCMDYGPGSSDWYDQYSEQYWEGYNWHEKQTRLQLINAFSRSRAND